MADEIIFHPVFMLAIKYKWWILFIFEIVAWIATFYMFFARYWFQSKVQFVIATVAAGITGYLPDLSLAIINFIYYKKIDFFIIFVIFIIVLGVILERKYLVRVDNFLSNWFAEKKRKLSNKVG